jgi:multidrug efflux system membrane fusion protein
MKISPHVPGGFAPVFVMSVLIALGGCGKEEKKADEPRAVNVVKAEISSGALGTNYTGEVRARFETQLGFRVPGKVSARLVEVGSTVKAGQVLARLDPGDQQLGIEAARQQLSAAQTNYDQSAKDLARFSELAKKGFVGAADLERRESAAQVAEAQLAQAKAQLGTFENQSAYTSLRADHDGIVTAIGAEVGQVVAAGQMVVRVARRGEREVVVNVPENRLSEVREAKQIKVGFWAEPDKLLDGRVREIAPSADPVTRTYATKITILKSDADIQLGMTANAYFMSDGQGSVVRLPSTALYQKGDDTAVWVVDPKTGQVSLRPVKVGRFGDDAVTIINGLAGGELVVRAGVHKLFPNEKVRILPELAP